MKPVIRDVQYPTQTVDSVEAKNVAKQNEWHAQVAVSNPKVQGDANKAKVPATVPTPDTK